MRTIIEIPDDMLKSLDRIVTVQKHSRASVIREAIAEYLEKETVPSAKAAFGLWHDRGKDGVQYQREIRAEWDDR